MIESPDDAALRRQGRRISLGEALLWMAGLAVALALPHWLDLAALPLVFYATFLVLTWRLASALSIPVALALAFLAAAGLAFVITLMVQH